ncbi:MAG: PAS domain-containing protein [Campylobacterales bacterium]|nr:PAS domain-containing protein [Campylobacterales bacterium]
MKKAPFWVGIGASAGGLEAIKELLGAFTCKEAVLVIAQHLDPKHPTILKDLLERITALPIVMVDRNTTPAPGTIYIIAPGHNAVVEEDRITLSPAALIGPKPNINEFFVSMASALSERAIGVILSGTGSDGAQGMIAIKAAGGITMAQDELSAKYTGMPRSAVETGFVDIVLPPRDIAREIELFIDSAEHRHEKFSGPKVRSNLEKIFQRLFDQTGYDFSGYKIKTIQRRIQRRMAVHKLVTLDDYVTLLLSSSVEVEALFKDLLISVTAFFRDEDAFVELKEAIDTMVQTRAHQEAFRIWVAGCANGEEAFSIAILFEEAVERHGVEIPYQIFATDIDDHALSLARRGAYAANQLKGVSPELLVKYFVEQDGTYLVKKTLRDHLVFARQNLITDPPFSHIDLISCRNVMIYFNTETQKKVFQTFHYALEKNGLLFLGKSESASSASPDLFEALSNKSQLFKRRLNSLNMTLDHINSSKAVAYNHAKSAKTTSLKISANIPLKEQLERTLIGDMIPAAIIINSQGQMLHIRGDLNRYLAFPEGRVENNIMTMARSDLKIDIRSLIQRAKRDGKAASQAIFFEGTKSANHLLYLTLSRMTLDENSDLYALAFFEIDMLEGPHTGGHMRLSEMSNERLQDEVEMFRLRLQTSIQDLETANEELQSANEELQSANEELQSANEELQTANEELQSTNEELSTVNEELEVKSYELSQVNSDLENMLISIDEIILFIDNRLRLQRYTTKAARIFDLVRDDLSQVITSFAFTMDIPNLRSELLNVIENEKESRIRVFTHQNSFDLRLVAYKADAKEVVGVMLFFEKVVTDQHDKGIQHLGIIELIGRSSRHAMLCLDHANTISYANRAALSLLGYRKEALLGTSAATLMPQALYHAQRELFDQHLADGDGWSSMTLSKADEERLVCKYYVEECVLDPDYERIIFFKAYLE